MARRPRTQTAILVDDPATGRRRRYCRRCGRELSNPASRLAQYGPDCDPARRPGEAREHHVDQDAIPGT
ncbi:DUF6011 domain-containing protein [Streptomyces sp. NPDC056652]|uniref:DUF6011 domain-containing protein n=1 Tax=Streptomyces sp. NPDC056652 TaxID=3345893 RepID=UPI0036C8A13F